MERPDVDSIEGLSPSIAIEQKTTTRSPRSTVGTITEIYDYLRVVYSSIGTPHCPNCGRSITRQSSEQIVQAVLNGELARTGDRLMIHQATPLQSPRSAREFRIRRAALELVWDCRDRGRLRS